MNASAALRPASEPVLVEGEFPLTRSDFARIAARIYADAGIHLSEAKATLVYSRLAKRLRALRLGAFSDYCDLLDSEAGADERREMRNALTTNVTRFFREPHHFDDLKARVIGPMADALRRGARMRFWSAACSTGQEPYSMALSLLELIPDAPRYDIKILATDIDSRVLETGRAAVYDADLVSPIPQELRRKWLERADADGRELWRMSETVRALVTFKPLNLVGSWPMRGPFDAIFCRNVAIYFDEKTQETIWAKFAPLLGPGGRLYIGHSERVTGPAAALLPNDGLTVYARGGRAG